MIDHQDVLIVFANIKTERSRRFIKVLALEKEYSLQDNILVGNCPLCGSENSFLATFTYPVPWGQCVKCLKGDTLNYLVNDVERFRYPVKYQQVFDKASDNYRKRLGDHQLYIKYPISRMLEDKSRGRLIGICQGKDLIPLTKHASRSRTNIRIIKPRWVGSREKWVLIFPIQRVFGMITGFLAWDGKSHNVIPLMHMQETDRVYMQMPADATGHKKYSSTVEMLSDHRVMEHMLDFHSVVSASIKQDLDAVRGLTAS